MPLASANYTTRILAELMYRSLSRAEAATDPNEISKESVGVVVFGVALVEAFINAYFRILVEDKKYSAHRDFILEGLGLGVGRFLGLAAKVKRWPTVVFGKTLDLNTGPPAALFLDLAEKRNALMHFVTEYKSISVPGVTIEGLADVGVLHDLTIDEARQVPPVAAGMIRALLEMHGLTSDALDRQVTFWMGP